jgi:hypothetical protein
MKRGIGMRTRRSLFLIILFTLILTRYVRAEDPPPVTPTSQWVSFWSDSCYADGTPLSADAVIEAFDPQNVLCGSFRVSSSGCYGLMAVYRDDALTPEDEGAQPGDTLHFTINGIRAALLGPGAPVWTANGAVIKLNMMIVTPPPTVRAEIKIFLQGAYNGGIMSTALAGASLIPLTQPYTAAPFSYAGAESGPGTAFFTSNPIVDWVLVELRTTATGAARERRAALLKNDGTLVDTDGSAGVVFTTIAPGPYYLVIRHRNHLAIMSSQAVVLPNASAYDFTADSTHACGHALNGMKNLTGLHRGLGGIYAMWAGDMNADGQVTALDFNAWLADTKTGVTGYVVDDYNLDCQATAPDFNLWLANTKIGAHTQVPE